MLSNLKIQKIFDKFSQNYSNPQTELKSKNHFTFLVSVVLSAQATDISVNNATKELYRIIKTPNDMILLISPQRNPSKSRRFPNEGNKW